MAVTEIKTEIGCLWAYTRPDLAENAIDRVFDEFGENATYTCETWRDGFFYIIAKPSDTVKTNVKNMKTILRSFLESHTEDFITAYRASNPWVMEEHDKKRQEHLAE